MEGEVGYETDTDQYKVGDGVNAWNALGYRGLDCVQQKGTSKTTPMSQDIVTGYLNRTGFVQGIWYDTDGNVLNIDYANKKVIYNGGSGQVHFVLNRLPWGSIASPASPAYETDFIMGSSTTSSQVWCILFNVAERKFYVANFQSVPSTDMDEDGNILWLMVGIFDQKSSSIS